MTQLFPIMITQDEDGMYMARVPTLRGCHTQAKTLPALYKRVHEAIALCMEVEKSKRQPISREKFVGVQQVEVEL